MDIFDIEPMMPGVPDDCGPEPCLREILVRYYIKCFDLEGAYKHADLYIEALKAKANN